jgi:hypothetical protein
LANGFEPADVERMTIWYDPSQVATRNDRAMDADSGFDRMAVSFNTWRHAHGFSEADAPTPTEMALRILMEKGSITPELTEAMLAAVAPEVIEATRAAQQASSVAPIPPEIQQMLQGGPPPPEPAPAPTPEPTPATAEENVPPVVSGPVEETPTSEATEAQPISITPVQ